jgi:ribosomal protein L40E/TolA-binding protein
MSPSLKSCPDCGARVRPDATHCDLCGSAVPSSAPVAEDPVVRAAGGYCSECGTRNPEGAKYCSECGSRLIANQAEPAMPPAVDPGEPTPDEAAADEPIGRQVAVLVGGAVLIVLALFVVTLVSRQNVSTGGAAPVEAPPSAMSVLEESEMTPLSDDLADQVRQMEEEISQLRGQDRLQRQHELVHLLVQNNRPDRAAIVQQDLAEQTGAVNHWRDAGDLYFEWMELAETPYRLDISRLAVYAYEQVLAEEPENHDVRANLAWALQYDAQNPMRAIDETTYILNAEPDHVQANFNRGYFLMRINRFDQAVEQMERVRELAGPNTPVGEQAGFLIDIIRTEQQRMRSGN